MRALQGGARPPSLYSGSKASSGLHPEIPAAVGLLCRAVAPEAAARLARSCWGSCAWWAPSPLGGGPPSHLI
jgi:hypothetical protein